MQVTTKVQHATLLCFPNDAYCRSCPSERLKSSKTLENFIFEEKTLYRTKRMWLTHSQGSKLRTGLQLNSCFFQKYCWREDLHRIWIGKCYVIDTNRRSQGSLEDGLTG
ncbi:unnamed protein product [Brugia pahangi]|uniref:PH domain-containing protein n=1 Tax=Brugia pahangi TaxID=6280 RepID=A0A0N4TV39_BRUPA|nr:unnamed protein product [Brugia pahangi]